MLFILNRELDGKVNYQTLSSRDLARSVMSTGGWSNILVFPLLDRLF